MYDASVTGRVLRKMRKRAKMSQQDVAKSSGFSRSVISRLERGARRIRQSEFPRLVSALNISEDSFSSQLEYVAFLERSAVKEQERAEVERLEQERKKSLRRQFSSEEVIGILENYFKDKPVMEVGLFGSFARGEQTLESDIDVYVFFDKTETYSPVDIGVYTVELQEITGYDVDVVDGTNLYDHVRNGLEADKILIYGKANITHKTGALATHERSR